MLLGQLDPAHVLTTAQRGTVSGNKVTLSSLSHELLRNVLVSQRRKRVPAPNKLHQPKAASHEDLPRSSVQPGSECDSTSFS